jgi:hypothetical protein
MERYLDSKNINIKYFKMILFFYSNQIYFESRNIENQVNLTKQNNNLVEEY